MWWLAGTAFRGLFRDERSELAFEVPQLLEVLVDAGEPHVGHVVELLQALEHLEADLPGRDLGPLARQALLDPFREAFHLLLGDRPVREGLVDPGHHLLAIPGLPGLIALHHHQTGPLDPFVGGEPPAARQALTPPSDRLLALGGARVHDLVLRVTAPWTSHGNHPTCSSRGHRTSEILDRQPADGTSRVWPGRIPPGSTPFADTMASTSGRGSSPGETPLAIDHSVSPSRTT